MPKSAIWGERSILLCDNRLQGRSVSVNQSASVAGEPSVPVDIINRGGINPRYIGRCLFVIVVDCRLTCSLCFPGWSRGGPARRLAATSEGGLWLVPASPATADLERQTVPQVRNDSRGFTVLNRDIPSIVESLKHTIHSLTNGGFLNACVHSKNYR